MATAKVRITVDLDPADWRQLQRWTAAAAEELGLVKVTSAAAVRAMIRAAASSPDVSTAVTAAIRAGLPTSGGD